MGRELDARLNLGDEFIGVLWAVDGGVEDAIVPFIGIEDPKDGSFARAVEKQVDGQSWRRALQFPMVVLAQGVVRLANCFAEFGVDVCVNDRTIR